MTFRGTFKTLFYNIFVKKDFSDSLVAQHDKTFLLSFGRFASGVRPFIEMVNQALNLRRNILPALTHNPQAPLKFLRPFPQIEV